MEDHCDRCLAQRHAQLSGVARVRGEHWAVRVAKHVHPDRPWPEHAGRAAQIARRRVRDLSGDPRLHELLAADLAKSAALEWDRLVRAWSTNGRTPCEHCGGANTKLVPPVRLVLDELVTDHRCEACRRVTTRVDR